MVPDHRGSASGTGCPSATATELTCAKYAISLGPAMYAAVGSRKRSATGRSRTLGPSSAVESTRSEGAADVATRRRAPSAVANTSDSPGRVGTWGVYPARRIASSRSRSACST